MMPLPLSAAGTLVRVWTRAYTHGLPPDERRARQAEIESDLWELQHEVAEHNADARRAAAHILVRLALGLPCDLLWRVERFTIETPLSWLKPAITVVSVAVASTFVLAAHPPVDLTRGLQVDVLALGWLSSGDSRPKVVPAFSFRLRNASVQTLHTVQVNAVFKKSPRNGDNDSWGTAFAAVAGSEGIAPGETTPALLLAAQCGYTDSAPDRLRPNALFRRLQREHSTTVTLFAKHESNQWTRLADYRIAPRLIER